MYLQAESLFLDTRADSRLKTETLKVQNSNKFRNHIRSIHYLQLIDTIVQGSETSTGMFCSSAFCFAVFPADIREKRQGQ